MDRVRDYRAHGSIDLPLPPPSALSPTQKVERCLQQLAAALEHDDIPPDASIDDKAALAIDLLKSSSTGLDQRVNVHLYSIPIWTDQEDPCRPFGEITGHKFN